MTTKCNAVSWMGYLEQKSSRNRGKKEKEKKKNQVKAKESKQTMDFDNNLSIRIH